MEYTDRKRLVAIHGDVQHARRILRYGFWKWLRRQRGQAFGRVKDVLGVKAANKSMGD